MKNSAHNIAVCAVFGALQLIFLVCAKYIGFITLSFYVLASCALMMPLTVKMYKEGILTYIAVSILSFFLVGIPDCLVYIAFIGAYTIFSVYSYDKKLPHVIALPIKIVWANVVFYIFYAVFTSFIKIDLSQFGITHINYTILVVIVSLVAIVYDLFLAYMYRYLCTLSDRIFKH